MDKNYIHNLTALRGIAAVLVAVLHFHFFLGLVLPKNTTGVIDKLYLMVDLFFILSGFIICYVYGHKFVNNLQGKDYKKFLIARIARIYPLHLFTLAANIMLYVFILSVDKFHLLSKWQQHLYRLDAIPVQLVFLQTVGIFNFDTWNNPAWSLSAEWWAYVIFPLLFIPIGRFKFKWIPIFSIVVIMSWLAIEFILSPMQPFMNHPPNPNNFSLDVNWHYGTIRGIVGFFAGMIIWRIYDTIKIKNIKVPYNDFLLLGITVLSFTSMHFRWYDTVTVSLFTLILLSAAIGDKRMNAFFSTTVLQTLGRWSFSIYIWHMVLINMILSYYLFGREKPIRGLLRPFNDIGFYTYGLLVLFLLLICFIGAVSYRFIEIPTRKWIKRKFM